MRKNLINKLRRCLQVLLLLSVSMSAEAQSSVDTHIAVNGQTDENTFVVIIANENYKYEQSVPFAQNDGETFRIYCEKTLGIPEKNIRFVADATLNDMRMQIQWLVKIMRAFEGQGRAIIYYSGHGMPSEDGNNAYLLPVDGNSTLVGSGLSTSRMYKQLGEMPSRATIVLLDACFSGARRDGKMLAASRGVALKAKTEAVTGNMVVFSAAQGNETAYPYTEKQHGLFTYYLLKHLQEKGGYISLGELTDNVTRQVKKMSIIENGKDQTPSVNAPSDTTCTWRSWMMAQTAATEYEDIERNVPETQDELSAELPQALLPATPVSQPVPPTPDSKPETSPDMGSEQTANGLTFWVHGKPFDMIRVEGGAFMMGATKDQGKGVDSNEKPAHLVTLSDYYIGETEVTQELWQAVMDINPANNKGANIPVEKVSWTDCQSFITRLNRLTGQQFRLPTEAEWEYAARGGTMSKHSLYAGSNDIEEVGWYKDNAAGAPHRVKANAPNELGIYDMSGNVMEWCQDWYADNYYRKVKDANPQGPKAGTHRVVRGGGWIAEATFARVAKRNFTNPDARISYIGLRLALQSYNQK